VESTTEFERVRPRAFPFALPPRRRVDASVVTARLSRSLVKMRDRVPRAMMRARSVVDDASVNDATARAHAREYFHTTDTRRPSRIARVASSPIGVVIIHRPRRRERPPIDRAHSHSSPLIARTRTARARLLRANDD